MNKENDISSVVEKKSPSVAAFIIIALIGLAAGALSYSLGVLMMLLYSVVTVFLASAKAPIILQALMIPAAFVPMYFSDAEFTYVMLTVWLCSVVGGVVIALGGDFHRSVMSFSFVGILSAVAGGTAYLEMRGITVQDVSVWMQGMLHDFLAQAIESAGDAIPLETARLLVSQYEVIAKSAVAYIPAVIGSMIVLFGIIAVWLCGFLHNITRCETYKMKLRVARVDRIFAVIWLASLLLGIVNAGVVGICASNIMLILMLPCAAAGLTEYRIMLFKRRLTGRRGLPFAVITLIIVFVFVSPVVGMMVLSLTGAFGAFTRKTVRRD